MAAVHPPRGVTPPAMNSNLFHNGIPHSPPPYHPQASFGWPQVQRRKVEHPNDISQPGHATRCSMDKAYNVVNAPVHMTTQPPLSRQVRVDPPIQQNYCNQQAPIGTPRYSPASRTQSPPLSPRSMPRDIPHSPSYAPMQMPAYHQIPQGANGVSPMALPTPPMSPMSPHCAPTPGYPFPAQPLQPSAQPFVPGPTNSIPRTHSQSIPHPSAGVQRQFSWPETTAPPPRTMRMNSDPQPIITPHAIPHAGGVGINPHPAQQTFTPQIPHQQFQQQYPHQQTAQPVTMPCDGSFCAGPVHPAVPQAPMPVANPEVSMRLYSYATGFNPNLHRRGEFRESVSTLSGLTDSNQDLAVSSALRALTQLTPYKLEAFKFEFKETTGKDLHEFCMSLVAKQDEKVRTLVAGLTLGPAEFDLYLLKSARLRKMDDDLMMIFVGRDQTDLNHLNHLWKHQMGGTLNSAIPSWTNNKNLQSALRICTLNSRDASDKPVDNASINRDVNLLIKWLDSAFTTARKYDLSPNLLELILKRNNKSIHQLALYFENATGYKLDEKIRKSAFDEMTKKIAVHAIRTAEDPTYRDLMCLKDVMGKSGKEVELGIRICRGHFYAQHWLQIQSLSMGTLHFKISDKVGKMSKGLFRDLLMAMMTPSS